MASPSERKTISFSVSQAYEDDSGTDSDGSEGPASESDVELTTGQRSSTEAFAPREPDYESDHACASNSGLTLQSSRIRARVPSINRTRPPRPKATIVSAPEIPQKVPNKTFATTNFGNRRSVSQDHTTLPSGKSNRSLQIPQRTLSSGTSFQLATSSTSKKRRRSYQDSAQNAGIMPQGLSRSPHTPTDNRLLPPSSVLPPRKTRCSRNPVETSNEGDSDLEIGSSEADDQSSLRSSHAAVEDALPPHIPELGTSLTIFDIAFEPYHSEILSIVRVTHKVFETMQIPLREKKDSDYGHVYALRIPERPGLIKIGRTKNPIDKRKREISRCAGVVYNLEAFNDDDFCLVENHTRVERLVHNELRNYRRRFPCPCKQKSHDGDAKDGMTSHGEWFEIDEAKAVDVVNRWRGWIRTKPYSDGILKQREKVRINSYNMNSDRMNAMVLGKDEDWCWNLFMESTVWHLRASWLCANFFGERYARSTCSPWDSLWKHWKSNVLFGLVFFLVSCLLTVLSDMFSLSFAFAPPPAVLNTLVLGSGAIFYAA